MRGGRKGKLGNWKLCVEDKLASTAHCGFSAPSDEWAPGWLFQLIRHRCRGLWAYQLGVWQENNLSRWLKWKDFNKGVNRDVGRVKGINMDVEGPRDVYQWGAITSLGLRSKGKKVLLVLEGKWGLGLGRRVSRDRAPNQGGHGEEIPPTGQTGSRPARVPRVLPSSRASLLRLRPHGGESKGE